jgi:hypothetical protein
MLNPTPLKKVKIARKKVSTKKSRKVEFCIFFTVCIGFDHLFQKNFYQLFQRICNSVKFGVYTHIQKRNEMFLPEFRKKLQDLSKIFSKLFQTTTRVFLLMMPIVVKTNNVFWCEIFFKYTPLRFVSKIIKNFWKITDFILWLKKHTSWSIQVRDKNIISYLWCVGSALLQNYCNKKLLHILQKLNLEEFEIKHVLES